MSYSTFVLATGVLLGEPATGTANFPADAGAVPSAMTPATTSITLGKDVNDPSRVYSRCNM